MHVLQVVVQIRGHAQIVRHFYAWARYRRIAALHLDLSAHKYISFVVLQLTYEFAIDFIYSVGVNLEANDETEE